MTKLDWTPDLDTLVRRLWERGWPAKRIAAKVGTTKNAIIGRAFRQKWVWGLRRPTHAPKPKQPSGKLPPTLLDLKPHMCKWPVNSPPRGGEYHFCGQPIETGSYCPEHAAIGFSGKGTARRTEVAGWMPRPVEFGR